MQATEETTVSGSSLKQLATAAAIQAGQLTAVDIAIEKYSGVRFFRDMGELVDCLFDLESALKASVRGGSNPDEEGGKLVAANKRYPVLGVRGTAEAEVRCFTYGVAV